MRLCIGWGLADLGFAHMNLAWSDGLGPGILHISFFLGQWSTWYMFFSLRLLVSNRMRRNNMIPPKICAWNYYQTSHIPLAKISHVAKFKLDVWGWTTPLIGTLWFPIGLTYNSQPRKLLLFHFSLLIPSAVTGSTECQSRSSSANCFHNRAFGGLKRRDWVKAEESHT